MKSNVHLKKVITNAGILLTGDIPANIFKLLSLSIFSHSLGVEKLGFYVLFLSSIEVIDRVFNFQTWQAFIKFANDFQVKNEHQNLLMLIKYSFLVDFISLSIATVISISLSSYALNFFNIPNEYYGLFVLLSITICFKIADLSTGIFRLYNQFAIQAKIAFYTSAIRFVLFGLVAFWQASFEAFIVATVLTQLINMLMKYFFANAVLNENGIYLIDIYKEKINLPLLKELKVLSFIIYNNFDVALRLVTTQLDIFMLGRLFGAELVSVYKITKESSKIILKVSSPVYQSVYPEFSKLIANNEFKLAKSMALKISIYAGMVGLFFYMLFYLFGEIFISIAFGNEMIQAYSVSMIYLFVVIFILISLPLPSLMHAMNLAKEAFYNQLISSIIYMLTLYYLVSEFSIYGAAYSM
ncbi:MAG: oligosaccharide flippase family protein, partial [Flavobacteriaceae bacterium]|nr:oligosaccharide flippase family protein [Flavobacteriaceae bacterium]